MPTSENKRSLKTQLAFTIAQGNPITSWARANNVPRRTANRWAKEPKVRAAVEHCRRRAIDRAIGLMARRATWATDAVAKLAKKANSEAVRLAALRSMLSDLMTVAQFSGLEYRISEIEGHIHDRTANPGSPD